MPRVSLRKSAALILPCLLLITVPIGLAMRASNQETSLPSEHRNFLIPHHKTPSRVILYVIDALRPDHLETFGYERSTAPGLAQLGREGAVFTHCFSNSTWSLASIRSLFVGMHGTAYRRDSPPSRVPESLELLAERLSREGRRTGIVTENLFVSSRYGMTQGFDFVGDSYALLESSKDKNAARRRISITTQDHLESFLRQCEDDDFFLYVHTMEPHAPLIIPDSVEPLYSKGSTPKEDLVGWYDTAIRWADQNLSAFVEILKKYEQFQDTMLIVTADHGESLYSGDSGGTHRGPPLRERIHVPLIIRWPEVVPAGTVINENVQLLDVAPTILDVLRVPASSQHHGVSLTRLLIEGRDDAFRGRPIFVVGEGMKGRGIVVDTWYYLRAQGREHLFDVSGDFLLAEDRIRANEEVSKRLGEWADSHVGEHQQMFEDFLNAESNGYRRVLNRIKTALSDLVKNEDETPADKEHIETLKSLGYL